jgi:hypothetical protein
MAVIFDDDDDNIKRSDLTDDQQQKRKEALDLFSQLRGDFDDNIEEIDNPNIVGVLDRGYRQEEKQEPVTVADKLLVIVNQSIVELFEDQYNKPYVVVKIDGRIEAIPIPVTHNNNGLFKKWICKTYYDSTKKLMSNMDAISAVSNHLSWKARYEGGKKNLDLRVSYGDIKDGSNKTIYYDLTNKHGDVVAITKDGWSIKKSIDVPIIFERRSIQRAQINPSPAGQYPEDIFEQFMDLLNVRKNCNDRLRFS